MNVTDLPEEAYALAIAGLPRAGPRRVRAVLSSRRPSEAWAAVLRGRPGDDPTLAGVREPWRAAATGVDVAARWEAHLASGLTLMVRGRAGYPAAFEDDPDPPEVLLATGDPGALGGPRVAIVGTRRCTRYGHDMAWELGRDLAAAGVRVVSGLALGIDGAAHGGALAAGVAPPVGVVATGLDVVYPRRHESLWRRVADAGVVLSEAPLGTRPTRWRFPARNRLIAALADIVVIVESHATGGSLITAREALDRDRPVMAVPGAVRSRASEGTNSLLADGAAPVRDAGDVLVVLGLDRGAAARAGPAPPDDPVQRAVVDALGWQPATLEHVVDRSGLAPGPAAAALAVLEQAGRVARRGLWWEQVVAP
jgi:DNA processing protein